MTGHIFLDGEIGDKITIESVRNDIAQYPQANAWEIHIDSPGGDVDTGYAIGAIISNLKNTTANIGALCASIVTYCAHCCDKIVMGPAGSFMIHLPTGTVNGTSNDLRRGADRLDRIKNELAARYMKRVAKKGLTVEQVHGMLDKETDMSPSEAEAMGFVDEVREKLKAVAKFNQKFSMESITKEEAKGLFEALGNKIDKLFKASIKAKNLDISLADGTTVTSDAADPSAILNSNVTDAKGAPLADGDYETADGFEMEVQGGIVTAYDPLMNDKTKPAAAPDMQKQVAALSEAVAALQAQLGATKNEAQAAIEAKAKIEAEAKAGSAEFKALKAELEELKTKTFGDDSKIAVSKKFVDRIQVNENADPMDELAQAWITSRPQELFSRTQNDN
jgi:ATP-dependent Clp protease, protease subunit